MMRFQKKKQEEGQFADVGQLAGDHIPKAKKVMKPQKAKMMKGRKGMKKGRKGMMKGRGKRDIVHHMMMGMNMLTPGRQMMMGKRMVNGLQSLWFLVKKDNGQCRCTQDPHGRVILGKFHMQSDCEDQRHGC